MCTSRNCCSVTPLGAPTIASCALELSGNAMTSRIEVASVSSIKSLSTPGAMPACGGAPYENAVYSAENLALSSSSE